MTIQRADWRTRHHSRVPMTSGVAPSGTAMALSSTDQYRGRSGRRRATSASIARGLQVALRPKKDSK